MSPARLSVRQPIFIASIVTLLVALGFISLRRLPIDLYPDVNFPTIMVHTTYSGAAPEEVETAVSKVLEDQISSIAGVKKVTSQNRDGMSLVMAEFDLKSDLNYAEQQVRARVTNALRLLPEDVDQPIVRQISPSDAPIMSIALKADLPADKLYDLAKERIAPQFEQVDKVGQVDILGGRKREVAIELDARKLRDYQMSATQVVNALRSGGRNVPAGKTSGSQFEYAYRTTAEFKSLDDIRDSLLRAMSAAYPVTVRSVGTVENRLKDETSRTRLNGERALQFNIFRQSGANSVAVAEMVKKKMEELNKELAKDGIKTAEMKVVLDASRRIRANVEDVQESILFGIILTVIVVYFFLGSAKSTLITGFALPNSLLGACIFMLFFGFSINIMSLLAMSLVVGLLVDDAIVVRENIFRKLEEGMSPKRAAVEGTEQVTLAVIATTATVLAVFGPIGNLEGIVGQFFKQFGLTVCFAMAVSLFDGLFVAPALSAYLGGSAHTAKEKLGRFARANKWLLGRFDAFQTWLERRYVGLLSFCLRHPAKTLLAAVLIFVASIVIAKRVPFTFISPPDNGEFYVQFELPEGSSLDAVDREATKIEAALRAMPQVEDLLATIGSSQGEANKGQVFVKLVGSKKRKENTSAMKKAVQEALKPFASLKPIVTDNPGQSGGRSFNLNLVGQNLDELVPYSEKVLTTLRAYNGLQQADTSYRAGRPEYRIVLKRDQAREHGVSLQGLGEEMRILVEGKVPAVYREGGVDYDVRVRLREDQRDPRTQFGVMTVPNINGRVMPVSVIAKLEEAKGPSVVLRENRARYIQITADLVPGGKGLGNAIADVKKMLENELKPPPGVRFVFTGEAERFGELMTNMIVSLGLGMLFIFLVLASLYGSLVTPFTIMLVIPLAASGAFFALFLARSNFDLFSMIGCVMLMGLATKNSILLVDYAVAAQKRGVERTKALLEAGEKRLRPILMTSLALIAGMIPVAIGLNEASKNRVSLGIVVIGGTISSTLLTLVVIPAAHMYVDRLQDLLVRLHRRLFGHDTAEV